MGVRSWDEKKDGWQIGSVYDYREFPGQVVLPSPVRRKLGLRKGTRINIVIGESGEGTIILQPLHEHAIRKVRGSLPGAGEALDYLQAERRRDRGR
jgi:AbrB family looped-hinge helix DNA binding protein